MVLKDRLKASSGVLDGWNKLAYSVHQVLHCCPDQASSGRPALQGFLSDPTTPSNVFFSETSEDSRARRARARDMLIADSSQFTTRRKR